VFLGVVFPSGSQNNKIQGGARGLSLSVRQGLSRKHNSFVETLLKANLLPRSPLALRSAKIPDQRAAEARRETNNLTTRAQHHAQSKNKKPRRPKGHSQSPTPTKSCESTTGKKTINRASSANNAFSLTPLKQKLAKAQQETPKAQFQNTAAQARRKTKKTRLASPTKLSPGHR
jgi:hypothetical protein